MHCDDSIPAIPLWIDGHAWFGVFSEFIDIREADGSVNFRVPKCGPGEAATAVASARRAQPAWADDAALRQRLLDQLAGMLDQFGGDLARLVARETGKPFAAAQIEVARAAAALRDGAGACGITPGEAAVQTVVGDAGDPLVSVVGGIARAIAAGGAVVVLSPASAPSASFALAELSARAGFPAGALCLLHGDLQVRVAMKSALGS